MGVVHMQLSNPQLIRSFGRGDSGISNLCEPTSVDDIRDVFDTATRLQRKVSMRGGGHSFHDQALHKNDSGEQIVVSTRGFNGVDFAPEGRSDMVRLGAGVQWGDYFAQALEYAKANNQPLRLPGSMQTGRKATVGGTASGDCLSRFSGLLGKESRWIESLRIVTPTGQLLDIDREKDRDLFNAVVGGHGYLGFITSVTYRLLDVDHRSCARTRIDTCNSFEELVAKQLAIVRPVINADETQLRGVSSVWFTDLIPNPFEPNKIKGAVFDSSYTAPSDPPLPGFPLYSDIDSIESYWVEVLGRNELINYSIHEILYAIAKDSGHDFENDLMDFIFFADGNTTAKQKYESLHSPELFPIIQQTFVVPPDHAVAFAKNCEHKMRSLKYHLRPTECDMLYVSQDECLLSANYRLDGFAISLGFEPVVADGTPPSQIVNLLKELSVDCLSVDGRIHLVKNVHADKAVLRQMFSSQLAAFEAIKRRVDPNMVLQNGFSDRLFEF